MTNARARAHTHTHTAGWIRKEYYGDSNNLWEHDISVAHADAALRAVLEATVVESYVDMLAPNLKGTPVSEVTMRCALLSGTNFTQFREHLILTSLNLK